MGAHRARHLFEQADARILFHHRTLSARFSGQPGALLVGQAEFPTSAPFSATAERCGPRGAAGSIFVSLRSHDAQSRDWTGGGASLSTNLVAFGDLAIRVG